MERDGKKQNNPTTNSELNLRRNHIDKKRRGCVINKKRNGAVVWIRRSEIKFKCERCAGFIWGDGEVRTPRCSKGTTLVGRQRREGEEEVEFITNCSDILFLD